MLELTRECLPEFQLIRWRGSHMICNNFKYKEMQIQIIPLIVPSLKITNEEWTTFVTSKFDLKICKCTIYAQACDTHKNSFTLKIGKCIKGENIVKKCKCLLKRKN